MKLFNPFGNFQFTLEDLDKITDEQKNEKILPVKCQCCGEIFYISKATYEDLRDNFNRNRVSLRTCSPKCANTEFTYTCSNCGKVCKRKWKLFRKTDTDELFCSPKCGREYFKKNDLSRKGFVAPVEKNPNGNYLFTKEEYLNCLRPSKVNEKTLKMRCLVCGEPFFVSANMINEQYQCVGRENRYIYCSLQCAGVAKRKDVKVKCDWCGKEFTKTPTTMTEKNFCCAECRKEYFRRNPQRIIRSRMELITEEFLKTAYPMLHLKCNDHHILDGSEMDIFIEELKMDVEIHGKQHYSNNTSFGYNLDKTKERDETRRSKCKEQGILLYEHDASSLTTYHKGVIMLHIMKINDEVQRVAKERNYPIPKVDASSVYDTIISKFDFVD